MICSVISAFYQQYLADNMFNNIDLASQRFSSTPMHTQGTNMVFER